MVFKSSAALSVAALCFLWGVCNPVAAQERSFSVVLPELQYSLHCSSEISLKNTSPRFVDVDVSGHKSNGALVSMVDRRSQRIRLAPAAIIRAKFDVQNEVAWAEIVEIVPSPRLRPVLSISGKTECLDVMELLTEPREIAPLVNNPRFSLNATEAGAILLVINASDTRMHWSACYSAGHAVSNNHGSMIPLCSEEVERSLAPYQSWRLPTSSEGNPLVRFRATGTAVAMQLLKTAAPHVQLYKVQSTISFDEPDALAPLK